jgi:ABC-type proline/glycine betaine transport system permease subunit
MNKNEIALKVLEAIAETAKESSKRMDRYFRILLWFSIIACAVGVILGVLCYKPPIRLADVNHESHSLVSPSFPQSP